MGIINVTPDSFYDGGKTMAIRDILVQAEQMLQQGATFLDIGGYSSRPGADDVSETDELERVLPAIEAILREFPKALISIDSFRSKIARKAVAHGACMVNDISGGHMDKEMIKTVAGLQVPYVAMHMRGTPQTMTQHTNYHQVTRDVLHYFSKIISEANKAGINDLIADPGFGFSKTRTQNFTLMNELELFQQLEIPLLVGISRKSMIYKTLGVSAKEALNGTTALHSIALLKGVHLLRVHDVKEAMECVRLVSELSDAQ
ncbi:MAG: dihydropteroate synthase [Bacteroidia bacterium]|nr:dihydropteroate synthase [Bacteroidia bacterium]NNF30354.1 dihydropteroate synthase [Flavobacteriaceae bacterium]MBT8276430.1 dihydropteroate synthase [Bacteroidia bacterium]NNJ80946.1 dihydropteroate synthase [Flavobacteriaceae bacterium]NNK53501.1 dihydropteroate synthase [Flavobacteriaceae bacterium]